METARPEPVSAPRPDPLDALLARARKESGDVATLISLKEAIVAAAARLPDPGARTRISQRATVSSMAGDLEGLARSVQELKDANAGRPAQ